MELLLIIILILILVGAFPAWPYNNTWGPYPFGIILFVILILVLLRLV